MTREIRSMRLEPEGGVEAEFRDALALLGRVRRRLGRLMEQTDDEAFETAPEIAAAHARLDEAVRKAFETEKRYHDWLAKEGGGPRPGEFDLAAIRHEIGCRLARLRTC